MKYGRFTSEAPELRHILAELSRDGRRLAKEVRDKKAH
jgi:hypothetical protein